MDYRYKLPDDPESKRFRKELEEKGYYIDGEPTPYRANRRVIRLPLHNLSRTGPETVYIFFSIDEYLN